MYSLCYEQLLILFQNKAIFKFQNWWVGLFENSIFPYPKLFWGFPFKYFTTTNTFTTESLHFKMNDVSNPAMQYFHFQRQNFQNLTLKNEWNPSNLQQSPSKENMVVLKF